MKNSQTELRKRMKAFTSDVSTRFTISLASQAFPDKEHADIPMIGREGRKLGTIPEITEGMVRSCIASALDKVNAHIPPEELEKAVCGWEGRTARGVAMRACRVCVREFTLECMDIVYTEIFACLALEERFEWNSCLKRLGANQGDLAELEFNLSKRLNVPQMTNEERLAVINTFHSNKPILASDVLSFCLKPFLERKLTALQILYRNPSDVSTAA